MTMNPSEEDNEDANTAMEIRYTDTTDEQLTQESDDFFSEFRTWRSWLRRPGLMRVDQLPDWPKLEFYMTWLQLFLRGEAEFQIPESWLAKAGDEYGVQAMVMWIWLQLEHSSDQEVKDALMEAAKVFWECGDRHAAHHPGVLMMEAGVLHRITDDALKWSTDVRAALRFQSVMRGAI